MGLIYNNMMINTQAHDGWLVAFGIQRIEAYCRLEDNNITEEGVGPGSKPHAVGAEKIIEHLQ